MTVGAQVKQCLSSLKNVRAGLQTFALQSSDESSKRELHEAMLICEDVIQDLKKRVGELEREEPQYRGF